MKSPPLPDVWQQTLFHTSHINIIIAAGTLQTCARLESGIEAAILAVSKSCKDEKSECSLLVDAVTCICIALNY